MDAGVLAAAHKAAVLQYNSAVCCVEDGNQPAAAAELQSLLSHTADALDDFIPMRAATMLVEVYLCHESATAASDLLDDLQTRFGASGAEEAGQAKAEMTSATPCQAWGWLLARLRFRVAVAAEDWALARLSLQTFTALATEPEQDAQRHALQGGLAYAQGDLEVAKASMLDLLHSTRAASAEERALARSNLGCLAARELQHNVALLCFSRALSLSEEPAGHGAASALDAFQTAHILRCAAIQHQALGEHVAGIRCLHAATTLAPADPAVWLLLGWAIAELAAYPAASEEAFHAVINLLGVKHEDVCHSRTRLLKGAELATDTAEHILRTTKQHSANGAEAGNSNALLVQTERAAALRIHLQQLQDAAASAKPHHSALAAIWDELLASQTTTALAMLRTMAQDT